MLLSWESFIQTQYQSGFYKKNEEIIDVLKSSMMRSILTAVMAQRKQDRSYLTDELTATTRKIPRICASIAYKK